MAARPVGLEGLERETLRGRPSASAGESDGARLLLEAAGWRMGHGAMPSLEAIRSASRTEPAHALRAAMHVARRHRDSLDAAALAQWVPVVAALGGDDGALAGWHGWIAGGPLNVLTPREASVDAAVEHAAAKAIAALERGSPTEGLGLARRAFRMARTEEHGPLELLTALVLARARRWVGQEPLAARIAAAVSSKAPPHWERWARWEIAACGVPEPVYEAAIERARLQGSLASPLAPRVRADLAGVVAVAQGQTSWNRLATAEPPAGLGTLLEDPQGTVGLRGFLVVDGAEVRRVPAAAVGAAGVPRLPAPVQSRSDQLLCLVAEAEGWASESAVFADAYGFDNRDGRYDSTFTVAIHRARQRLGDHGKLERTEHGLRLVGKVAIPDPRTQVAGSALLLRSLAARGDASARELAERVDVPLRSVQRMLRDLAESGACEARGRGRATRYVLEDTTFSEPTEAARWLPR